MNSKKNRDKKYSDMLNFWKPKWINKDFVIKILSSRKKNEIEKKIFMVIQKNIN